jgi:hypothetical protein
MKGTSLILFTALIFAFTKGYSNQDMSAKPTWYTFIFTSGDTVILKNPTDEALAIINSDISSHKRILTEAQLLFTKSQKIVFKYEQAKLVSISIIANNKETAMPKNTIGRIKEVYFQTLSIVWDGSDKNAFNANFFYIQFHIGPEKSFGKYPYVQLKFLDHKYVKSTLWSQANESSLRFRDL